MRIEAIPRNQAGELALAIFEKTLGLVRGDLLVQSEVWLDGDLLNVDDLVYDLKDYDRLIVAGAGKASASMARGVEKELGERIHSGLIITKHGHSEPLTRCRIIEAGHPVPDEFSLLAGEEMLKLAASVTEKDLVLFLLSGGASALMETPVDGVSLADLQLANEELLASGATIMTMNAVRSRLSQVKAGGLARAFVKAAVVVVFLSDVQGDPVNVIGSGPFVPPHAFPDLTQVAKAFGLDKRLSPAILKMLGKDPYRDGRPIKPPHRIAGNARMMRQHAEDIAEQMGLRPFGSSMFGEAKNFPGVIQKKRILPHKRQHDCLIFTGETVVHKTGNGLGGRAQEMACVFADVLQGQKEVAALVAGSDGSDGPTDAAGALVDGDTLARAKEKGFTVEETLKNNDSYHFHEAAGTLIKTGPTGTNLNDILIVVRA